MRSNVKNLVGALAFGFAWMVLQPSLTTSQEVAVGHQESEVEFTNGDIRLAGVVISPKKEGKSAGVVIIHGSGDSDRRNAWAASFARGLADRGLVVLLPDKRGSGKSGGDWKTSSFEDLAADAIAGVEFLRGRPGVRPELVGVLGLSQGGHVAPLAATRSSNIAFVVDVSGSTVPIREQIFDEVEKLAKRSGLSPEQIERVNALHRLAIQFGVTGKGWEDYFKTLNGLLKSDLAGRGIIEPFPKTQDHWVWTWARIIGDYDPLPYWKNVRVRFLIAYGARDTQIRVGKSTSRLVGAMESADRDYMLVVYGDSGHGIRDPHTKELRTDFLDLIARWVGNAD